MLLVTEAILLEEGSPGALGPLRRTQGGDQVVETPNEQGPQLEKAGYRRARSTAQKRAVGPYADSQER